MRRLVLSTAALTLLVSQSYGQQSSRRSCTTQYIPESCTQPPTNQSAPDTSTPQSVPDEGGFAAPPRTGTAAGETRSFGIEGFGVHIPSMSIRMPTLQLPGIVRYRREPRMLIDSSEAPFVRQSTRELTVPAGDNLVRQSAPDNSVPQSAPDNSTRQSSPDGCTRGVGMSQPEIMPPDAPVPPQPARAGVYPNFGAIQASPDAQVVQDPQTGRFYRVVLQPMPMQSVSQAMPQQAVVQNQFASHPTASYPNTGYATTGYAASESLPVGGVRPISAETQPGSGENHIRTGYDSASTVTNREVALMNAVQEANERAAELEGQMRRLESMIGQMSQVNSGSAPQTISSPGVGNSGSRHASEVSSSTPIRQVAADQAQLEGTDEKSTAGGLKMIKRLFKPLNK